MMRLRDLYLACERFVPKASRHPNSFREARAHRPDWWPAHELGHYLTVDPNNLGLPMFGLDDDTDPDGLNIHERRCRELAAMHVSYRLLVAAECWDLADLETEDTDMDTIAYATQKHVATRVRTILDERRIYAVPTTRQALETKCRLVLREKARLDFPRLVARPALRKKLQQSTRTP